MLISSQRGSPGDVGLATLFAGLDAAPALLLAVSGGPDSVALLHLAVRWRADLAEGPRLHVATVDHRLRPEAKEEAEAVATLAARHGLPHATLPWVGSRPASGLSEKAREARYALLSAHAAAVGAPFLLTAHHADDQAETVLMRLGRGSGLAGLAAMRRETPLGAQLTLVRPLLGQTKRDLLCVCAAAGLPFASDPSNEDPAFLRARLRRQAETAASLGLDGPALRRLSRRMARADDALEAEAERVTREGGGQGVGHGWRVAFAERRPHAEIMGRVLARGLRHITRHDPEGARSPCAGWSHVPLRRRETMADALCDALRNGRMFRATLGGALLTLDAAGVLAIVPEPPRRRGRAPRLRPN